MKNSSKSAIILTLIMTFLFSSCHISQNVSKTSETTSGTEGNSKQGQEIATETPESVAPPEKDKFSIEADENLIQPITILYQTYYDNQSPDFIDTGGDLIATESFVCDHQRPCFWPTFLPGSILIKKADNSEIDNFIAFTVSAEGQQVLVDAGELPGDVSITDQAGNDLLIEQPVHRVISSYGPTTSFMYSLQVQDRLVAASFLGARDPMGATVLGKMDPRFPDLIGDEFFNQSDFNIEQAATLDPDLIVTSARTSWLDTVDQIGIDVFLFDAETPARLKEAMRLTGKLFGPNSSALAETWVAYYDLIVEEIRMQTSSIPVEQRKRILFTGTDPLRIASGDMNQTFIIQAAGGISASAELTGYWNDVDLEQIALWNPDIIIVPPYGGASVEAITESSEWQILDAVKEGQVHQMPKLVVPWDIPAADSVLGIVWIAKLINDKVTGLDCESEVEYFYNTFYNYAITSDEIEKVCKFE